MKKARWWKAVNRPCQSLQFDELIGLAPCSKTAKWMIDISPLIRLSCYNHAKFWKAQGKAHKIGEEDAIRLCHDKLKGN